MRAHAYAIRVFTDGPGDAMAATFEHCRQRRSRVIRLVSLLALVALPHCAAAATSARQELAQVFASKPDAQRGAELFRNCVSCHGSDGSGDLNGNVPRIAGQHYRVLVRQLIDFRHGKRWDYRMEGVTASHNAIPELQDVADVAAHVSQLDRNGARGVGDGQSVELGAKIYTEKCSSCHGTGGEGDDAGEIPRLAGQHAAYLSRQIYDTVDRRRPPLARTHRRYFEPLSFEEIRGLADHLSRIGQRESRPPGAGTGGVGR
jgi:cytochrome c553